MAFEPPFRRFPVAPFTGAWIEILMSMPRASASGRSHPSRVRGLKSLYRGDSNGSAKSHPSRVRGLKSVDCIAKYWQDTVAPFTGAWIEITALWLRRRYRSASHPSRVRGLKSDGYRDCFLYNESHPSRVRGLK